MTVRTWHAKSSKHPEERIYVTPQGIQDLNLVMVENVKLEVLEEVISIQHKNKWGQDYPAKY